MEYARAHPLYEQARRALEGLRDLRTANVVAAEIDRAWARVPFVVGLGGEDVAARTALINALCGGALLDPEGRTQGCAIRIRRSVSARFRARRDDGSIEEHGLESHADGDAARARFEVAHTRFVEREVELVRVERALPRLLRARPGVWRILLWPIWWLWMWLRRTTVAEHAIASEAVDASRRDLDVARGELDAAAARARDDHVRYVEAIRALASQRDVVELALEVAGGPLDSEIEVCELDGFPASLDVVLLVEGSGIRAPDSLVVTSHDDLIATLPAFMANARAMRLARRARETITLATTQLDDHLNRAEDEFRRRIAAIEARRLGDPGAFSAAQLARIRPEIVTSVTAVIEHASVHLGSELAALGEEWIGGIANAASSETLKEVVTRIETTAAASAQRIAEETRMLVINGGGGSTHDLYPELMKGLITLGLPDELATRRTTPGLPPIAVLPALANASVAKLSGAWLTGLFRSFEARRTEVREKTHAQIEHLRELATDELFDVEPQLHAAIEQVLAAQLEDACERQSTAVEDALVAEHAAVVAERARLAPMIEQRDRAHTILGELHDHITSLETELPECAAASAAVP